MFSTRNRGIIVKGVLLVALTSVLAPGCSRNRQSQGPFSDVVRERQASVTQEPVREEQPAVTRADLPDPEVQANANLDPVVEQASVTPASETSETSSSQAIANPTTRASSVYMDIHGGARRNWPQVIAYRPSGDVIAGPTYKKRWISQYATAPWALALAEPADFLISTFLMPVSAVLQPPLTAVQYSEVDDASTSPAERSAVANER